MNFRTFAFAGLLLSGAALAQSSPGDERPAVQTGGAELPAATAPTRGNDSGTTIIGERESPIGLYITPWRNAAAEADIDRPPRLLGLELTPLDRKVFARQVEYYEALTAAQRAKRAAPAAATPAAP